jgi:spore germination protein GerM
VLNGRHRRLVGVFGVLVAIAGLVACGLPDDDRPRAIGDDAPRDLTPSTSAPEAEIGADEVDVYFIDTETQRLRAVERQVQEATPDTVIGQLLRGPGERSAGEVTSSIPVGTELIGTKLEGDVLLVDLGPAKGGIVGVDATVQLQAFAQLVWTATALENVSSVRFTLEGNPLPVTTDSGAVDFRSVNRTDYASLAPTSDGTS